MSDDDYERGEAMDRASDEIADLRKDRDELWEACKCLVEMVDEECAKDAAFAEILQVIERCGPRCDDEEPKRGYLRCNRVRGHAGQHSCPGMSFRGVPPTVTWD